MMLNEGHGGGATTEGFDAQRPGSGVQVEHTCSAQLRTQDGEEGFLHTIGGRPDLRPFRSLKPATFQTPGNDTHRCDRTTSCGL